jgi:predicted O-methyltransferase YrrM
MLSDADTKAGLIESFVTQTEGKILYEYARKARKGIVEIGSFKGRSSIYLAQGSMDGNLVPIMCVDTWKDCNLHMGEDYYEEFLHNTSQYHKANILIPLRGKSNEVASNFLSDFDVLFIDADHEEKGVFWDWGVWAMKMTEGIVLLHDIRDWPAPRKLIDHLELHGLEVERFGNLGVVHLGR